MFEGVGGADAAGVLAAVAPADLEDADLLEAIRAWERLASWAAAGQLAAIAELARRRPRDYPEHRPGRVDRGDPRVPQVSEFAVDEVAAGLRLTRLSAGLRVQLAVELAGRLPGTAAALHEGRIDVPRARVLLDAVAALDDRLAAAVEAQVLPAAGGLTTGQLRAAAARAVLAVDPAAAERRHRHAVTERAVTLRALPDGMAGLWALLPADAATAVYTRLDHLARRCPAGDPRRADALLTLTLGDSPAATTPTSATSAASPATGSPVAGPAVAGAVVGGAGVGGIGAGLVVGGARVYLTVSAGTVLGMDDQPGQLAGYGPVPASMARRLAAHGDWRRVLTDPATGTVIDVGRDRYTPTAAVADLVRTRDRTCRFPGCRQPAHRCDLDHIIAWPAGASTPHNLATLCRHHHRLKHQTRWTVHPGHQPGELTWTSPTGHHYTTTPTDP